MALDVETIHQPQWTKVILGDFFVQITMGLIAILFYTIVNKLLIFLRILVHGLTCVNEFKE